MNSMTHEHGTDSASVSQDTPEPSLKVTARRLTVEEGDLSIAWEDAEVQTAIRNGYKKSDIYLPCYSDGGYVVIGLDSKGDYPCTEVATEVREQGGSVVDLLERAATQLQILARGIRQAQGVAS